MTDARHTEKYFNEKLLEGGILAVLVAIATKNYDRSPVDDRFVMIELGPQSDATTELVIVENWFEEVKRSDLYRSAD